MASPRVGIIGGTGIYDLGPAEAIELETPFGNVTLQRLTMGGRDVFFLPRHGPGHERPPHKINHKAHVAALAAAHCDWVIATNNVGSLVPDLKPGAWTVLSDFIDRHRAGPITFHDDRAVHVDFTEPYCPTLGERLARAAGPKTRRVTYVGVDGPRFETPAEARLLAQWGGHVVGMTGVPEATLAHERGLCYGAIAYVANAATASGALSAKQIQGAMRKRRAPLWKILNDAVKSLPSKKSCSCGAAGRFADITNAAVKG